jgi:SAM-dependent methyltransferase
MSNSALSSDSADVSKSEIAEFYNDFSGRLVRGFVTGNPRIEHALAFASNQLPAAAQSLLEVGCGVGETTNRLCAARSNLRAVGVDISPENIRAAERLFGQSAGAAFAVSDLTQPVDGGPFDVVTLLDVYEHIPSADRESFHANLRQSMSDQSRLIVTCPSFLHQNFLHEHQPEGLQIVDETIGVPELMKLASDLGGTLSHLHYESVWRTNDYLYATIDTVMSYQWKEKPRGLRRLSKKITRYLDKTPLGGPARRERYVKDRLAA